MTFSSYPAYKNSGVEWLGEVPQHWTVIALKWLSPVFRGASPRPIDDPVYFDDDGEFGWVRIADVTASSDGYLYETTQKLSALGSSLSVKLEPGELFLSIAGSVGKPCITAVKACIHDGFVYFPWLSIDQRLLYRVFESGLCFGGLGKMGTQLNLNTDTVGGICIAVPPEAELSRVLAFLDHETARIDALIEEQQRLIELLKEKRQAVISHAVTKGLDLTAPMKDSGVDWLGEVPAHWVVCATRRAIRFIEQGWSPECESYPAEEDGWGVLKAGCVNRGFFDSSENKTLPSTLKPIPEYEVRAGDILMSRASGSPELVGSTALLGQVRERLMLSDKIFRVHLEEKVSSQFFVWVMNAQFMRSQIEQALSGGNGLANNLPQSSLLAFWLAIPPEHEQGAIAELINEKTGRIDELIAEGDLAVELLQERRSALISAAVTGKIDVRGWQPPTSAPSPELALEAV